MKKVFFSLITVGLVGGVAVYSSNAFFSDQEVSSNNIFQSGKIDLRIANQSYIWKEDQWQYNQDNSWALQDLFPQFRFFNFLDVKPGDLSQDTITIQVDDNEAYVCADLSLTENSENQVNETELLDGDTLENGQMEGELDENLEFVLWADDGDFTLEIDETVLFNGAVWQLLNSSNNYSTRLPIIDSLSNPWSNQLTPLMPNDQGKIWLGKAWCAGTLTLQPQPKGNGISQQRPPSVLCDGAEASNIFQTDVLKGDIGFYAVQSRNNQDFVCNPDFVQGDSFSESLDSWISPDYEVEGNWQIINQELFQNLGNDHLNFLFTSNSFENHTVETRVRLNGPAGYGGTTIWHYDSNNWIDVFLYPTSGNYALFVLEKVNGVETGYSYPFIAIENQWYKLTVAANSSNSRITLYVDDQMIAVHKSGAVYRSGLSGLNTGNSGGYFDDFLVY